MIDEIEPDECKFDASENDQLSMLSADDAARLTEMLVSAQNNTPQDLVLTGSIRFVYCFNPCREIAAISAIYLDKGGPIERLLLLRARSLQPARAASERQSRHGTSLTARRGIKSTKVRETGFSSDLAFTEKFKNYQTYDNFWRTIFFKRVLGDSLTSRYRDTLIHKFDKDELILKLNRDEVEFRPYFDEQFCFLRLVVVDRKVSNYIYCVNCKQLLCFFAININSGGKVQVSTFSFAFRQAIFSDQHYQET